MAELYPQEINIIDFEGDGGWGTAEVLLIVLTGVVAFAALLAYGIAQFRTSKMAAALDNATAELGVQRDKIVNLEHDVRRRDMFIARNVINGPEAYSAAHPETPPEYAPPSGTQSANANQLKGSAIPEGSPSVSGNQHKRLTTLGDAVDGVFSLESDSDSGSDSDNDENVQVFRSLTPVPAVLVQANNIRKLTLQPKKGNLGNADPDGTEPGNSQPPGDIQDSLDIRPENGQQREGTEGLEKEAQNFIASYWEPGHRADSDQRAEPSPVQEAGAVGQAVASDVAPPTEVEDTVTEADEDHESRKDISAVQDSYAVSTSSNPSSGTVDDGSESPKSPVSSCSSLEYAIDTEPAKRRCLPQVESTGQTTVS